MAILIVAVFPSRLSRYKREYLVIHGGSRRWLVPLINRVARVGCLSNMTSVQGLAGKLTEPYRYNAKFGYEVPQALIAVWLACGPDFQLIHDIQDDDGLDGLVHWWLTAGRPDFEGLGDIIDRALAESLHLGSMRDRRRGDTVALTPMLRLVMRYRTDLAELFDIDTDKGISELWYWWLLHGQQEYMAAPQWLVQAQMALLHECETDRDGLGGGLPPTPLLRLIWSQNADLRASLSPDTVEGRQGLWHHFLMVEVEVLSLPGAGVPVMPNLRHPEIPDPVLFVYALRADLRHAFDIGASDGAESLVHWWLVDGWAGYPQLGRQAQPAFERLFAQSDADLMPFLALIWRQRPDLRQSFDIHTQDGRDGLIYWWLAEGRRHYPAVAELADRALAGAMHLEHLPAMAREGRLSVTPLMALILQHRPDVQEVGGSETEARVKHLWWWWLADGQQQYLDRPDWLATEQVRWLHRCEGSTFAATGRIEPTLLMSIVAAVVWIPPSVPVDAEIAALWTATLQHAEQLALPDHGMPRFNSAVAPSLRKGAALGFKPLFADYAAIIHVARPDIAQLFDLQRPGSVRLFIDWYLQFAPQDYPRLTDPLGPGPRSALVRPMRPHHASLKAPGIGWLFELARANGDPEAQGSDDARSMETWWTRSGQAKYRAVTADDLAPAVNAQVRAVPPDPVTSSAPGAGPSISLVGYPRGEFGLGEDIRLLRAAMQAVDIEPTVVRAPWNTMARQGANEPSVEADLAEFGTDVMFYVMPAFDTTTLLTKVGARAFTARRRIGFWQWELERFPEPAKIAMELIDEIWCHSEHSARAFRRATDKPVVKVPLPVAVPQVQRVDRTEFGLPESGFVVFTSFDGASSISRKNPLGAILAFQAAFPARLHPTARLVIKAMNTHQDSLWRECMRKAAIDDRILIRNEVMDRVRYYELLKCCDAVISLHRAEGFGRLMAEAMGMGVPVIATAYSGNMDFMTADNSWLVTGDMVPVFAGDYAFHSGQLWMEPNIAIASRALQNCADDRDVRESKVLAARMTIERYGPYHCGMIYKKLLADR